MNTLDVPKQILNSCKVLKNNNSFTKVIAKDPRPSAQTQWRNVQRQWNADCLAAEKAIEDKSNSGGFNLNWTRSTRNSVEAELARQPSNFNRTFKRAASWTKNNKGTWTKASQPNKSVPAAPAAPAAAPAAGGRRERKTRKRKSKTRSHHH
jgi:hypothetical protein